MNIARLIVPALRWRDDSGFGHEAGRIDDALSLGVGGFIIFGGTAEAVRALCAELRRRSSHPLLLAADLERGAGQQFEGLTQVPPPRALAALRDETAIEWAGAVTAREARAAGLNWVFAPVADLDVLAENPIVQTRAFGDEPAAVGRAVAAWVRGCQGAGALACAKHYPGHGRTTLDSHMALPSVDAPRELLERDDLAPFRAAVAAGVASLMTAHVAYPALDPTGAPATLSPTILGMLRRSGFDGLVVSDALIMEGALGGRTEASAAVAALAAGVDVLLYPEHPRAVAEAVAAAVAEGRLPGERVREALHRVRHAVEVVEAQPATATPEGHTAGAIADALLRLPMARGAAAPLAAPIELLQVDDDLGGPFPPTPSTAVRERLAALGVPMARGGSRVVLVFAEPRAWKGRSGLGEASRAALASASVGAALVVLFGHPRLVAEVPDGPAVLVAWHRQRLMQEAVAQWLADAVRARA